MIQYFKYGPHFDKFERSSFCHNYSGDCMSEANFNPILLVYLVNKLDVYDPTNTNKSSAIKTLQQYRIWAKLYQIRDTSYSKVTKLMFPCRNTFHSKYSPELASKAQVRLTFLQTCKSTTIVG